MASTLIRGGRVIDPAQNFDRVANVLIEEGRITSLDAGDTAADQVIEAQGRIVAPGFVDLHAQLREPGGEDDETIASGTAAALAGGFTSVACLPNTEPPIDTQAQVEFVRHRANLADNCRVYVIAAISKGRAGSELAELGILGKAGAVAFSDGPDPVANPNLMRRALEYCLMFDKPLLNRADTWELSGGGIMHEGLVSLTLGLPGVPSASEDVMTSRDIRLAETTGGRVHMMCVSTDGSVELVRRAKGRGVQVTCDVTPHHFSLTDEALRTFDANCKLQPPLRSQDDVDACIAGLRDGTIDCIASDHAPVAIEKKMQELDRAPFGAVGLETLLGLVVTNLIEPGHLDWPTALAKLTCNPARMLGINCGTLAVGAEADITVVDPQRTWTVDPHRFHSQSKNTPYAGWQLQGRVETVLVGGRVKYRASEIATVPG